MSYGSNYYIICKGGDTNITEFGLIATDMLSSSIGVNRDCY